MKVQFNKEELECLETHLRDNEPFLLDRIDEKRSRYEWYRELDTGDKKGNYNFIINQHKYWKKVYEEAIAENEFNKILLEKFRQILSPENETIEIEIVD